MLKVIHLKPLMLLTIAANEDAPSASTFETMDPERRRWLEEAIESMTVDVVKQVIQVNHFSPMFPITVEPHYFQ